MQMRKKWSLLIIMVTRFGVVIEDLLVLWGLVEIASVECCNMSCFWTVKAYDSV